MLKYHNCRIKICKSPPKTPPSPLTIYMIAFLSGCIYYGPVYNTFEAMHDLYIVYVCFLEYKRNDLKMPCAHFFLSQLKVYPKEAPCQRDGLNINLRTPNLSAMNRLINT